MIKIGLIKGKETENINNLIKDILFFEVINNIEVYILDYESKVYDCDIIIIDSDEFINLIRLYLKNIKSNVIILLNIDNIDYKFNLLNNAILVTYGINTKACFTVSSLSTNYIQFCIQKSLPTLYGEILDLKEFSIKINYEINNIYNLLPSIGSLILSGVNVSSIYLRKM